MIPVYSTSALVNHLWQSTLFAAVAGLLSMVLRKNHARVRYWLWLVASVKFLIPFSLLAGMGGHLSWPHARGVMQSPQAVTVVEEIFSSPVFPAEPQVNAPSARNLVPPILFAVWLCGFLVVVFCWWTRWRRVRAAVRSARPLSMEAQVPILSSPVLLEPGVFGVFRPVLLLPEGIRNHLSPAQLEAILAHELCHVRRRDNLAAAIHMLVEAVFWFHPLVWWIGVRLVEERERACDEEVLRLGNAPQAYAESILKTCEFYLESPLACVSGVTGADLKKRIVRIMTAQISTRLNFSKKLLLAIVGAAAIAGPVAFGVMMAPQTGPQSPPQTPVPKRPSFEVASIKPNNSADRGMMIQNGRGGRFVAKNITVKMLMRMAYKVQGFQISGGPGWINSERFDIEAKPESGSAGEKDPFKLNDDEREALFQQQRERVQSLLADRFNLKLHRESKELPVYALVVAKNGPKLQPATFTPPSGDAPLPAPPPPGSKDKGAFKGQGMRMGPGELVGNAARLSMLTEALSNQLGRTVLDKTRLTGTYDFSLKWTPDQSSGQMFKGPGASPDSHTPNEDAPPESSGPTIFTALQEQLGLKLESQKGPVEVLVVDQVEKPSEN